MRDERHIAGKQQAKEHRPLHRLHRGNCDAFSFSFSDHLDPERQEGGEVWWSQVFNGVKGLKQARVSIQYQKTMKITWIYVLTNVYKSPVSNSAYGCIWYCNDMTAEVSFS